MAPGLQIHWPDRQDRRILDNDAVPVEPSNMLAELREDNASSTESLRGERHEICEKLPRRALHGGLVEVWIDETSAVLFLFADPAGEQTVRCMSSEQARRSVSSIHTSTRLAVAMSSQISWASRRLAVRDALSSRNSASISEGST